MKVAIVGSRNFTDYAKLEGFVLSKVTLQDIDLVISGGASGADGLAEKFAYKHNLKKLIFKAEWDRFGKSAGFIRNKSIVNEADIVIAFWDGYSPGTKMTIELTKEKNKPVYVLMF